MTKWLNKRGLSWTNDGASTQWEKYAAINYQAPEDDLLSWYGGQVAEVGLNQSV